MIRKFFKTDEGYDALLAQYPYVFSIRNYTYFFTKEEWAAIPITNTPPAFNPETQDLLLEEYEDSGVVKRRWVVSATSTSSVPEEGGE